MPGQLFGYGRSDRSSKLIRGFESETPAGFRSRRGFGHDPAPVTPDNALFASYKTPRVHHAARRRGRVATSGARAAGAHAAYRRADGGCRKRPRSEDVDSRVGTAAATAGV